MGNGSKKNPMEAELLLSEEKIEAVSSADGAATLKPQQCLLEMHLRCHGCIYSRVAALIGTETVYDGFLNNACT